MAAVDEPEELTIKEAITTFHDEFPNKFTRMMRAIRPAKNNHESAVMAQKVLAPCGFSSLSGSSVMNYEFRGMSAGAKFECKGRTLNTSYRYLVEQARFMYDPFSPEFDDPEDQSAAGVPDNLQQDDFVEATKIEEHIVENNKMSDHAGDITEMASADSSEISIQPPLPVMKNNDQRKEWLRNYKEWGLWYTDEHIGARYYKYDFENGTRLIVEEYDPEPVHNSPWAPNEPYYMHLVGGPEPERNNEIPKWTYHSKYNKYPNSETELVEFLKGVQK